MRSAAVLYSFWTYALASWLGAGVALGSTGGAAGLGAQTSAATLDPRKSQTQEQPSNKPPKPAAPPGGRIVPQTVLTIQGTQFAINGKPAFLQGISYYGALGAPEPAICQDLADLRDHGFNWIRIWANWAAFDNDVSAVDLDGHAREPYLSKLKWLIAECDRRRIIVDVTLSRGNGVTGPPRLQTLEAHRTAVRTLATALRPYRNWYLDLSNERNIRDERFTSMEHLKLLRQEVRRLDPRRLVTASHAGEISHRDLETYLMNIRLDFIAPHRPRHGNSPLQTEEVTRRYLLDMKELGCLAPVHYQEPFRRGLGKWTPKAQDFLQDLAAARNAGAAGWCFHNGDQRPHPEGQPRRSFDLRQKRLFEQLDEVEQAVLNQLALEPEVPSTSTRGKAKKSAEKSGRR